MIRLAILTSHPIQYQAPLFRMLAAEADIDLQVYFERNLLATAAGAYDPEFGKSFKWDIPLLEGYSSAVLKGSMHIISELRRRRPDALWVYGWNSAAIRMACITAFLLGIPIIVHSENPLNQELRKSAWKRWLKKILLASFLKMTSAGMYIGSENRKFYEYYGLPSRKFFFAPYAVDNARFMAAAQKMSKEECKTQLGIPPRTVAILFSGKLIEKKRVQDVLAAYARIASADTALVFVGDGALRGELEGRVTRDAIPGVLFAGFKNQSEMPACYNAADIFVLPSGDGETWGLAVNEAMCSAVPVVVSDRVGCGPDLVRPGENGFIVPFGDVNALAAALGALIRDPEKRHRFGARSLAIVQEYDFAHDLKGIRAALAAVVTRNSAAKNSATAK